MAADLIAAAALTIRVLFIGNSLTAANGLPATLEALARSSGNRIECVTVAYPGYSLQDHWERGEASRAIARGGWTFVVLQQGPSALPESRALLIDYAQRYNRQIRAVGATPAIFMVWPSLTRRGDFDAVSGSYAAAAKAVGGIVLPVGDAWRAAWRRDVHLPLYGPDGFHPSPMASYLAALVMYQQFFGRSAAGAPPVPLDPGHASILRQSAEEANKQFPANAGRVPPV